MDIRKAKCPGCGGIMLLAEVTRYQPKTPGGDMTLPNKAMNEERQILRDFLAHATKKDSDCLALLNREPMSHNVMVLTLIAGKNEDIHRWGESVKLCGNHLIN